MKDASIQFVDMKDEPELMRIESMVSSFVKRVGQFVDIESIAIQEQKSHKAGRRRLYDFKVHLSSPGHFFVSSSSGWSAILCIEDALDKLEKEMKKVIQKQRARARDEEREIRGK